MTCLWTTNTRAGQGRTDPQGLGSSTVQWDLRVDEQPSVLKTHN